MRGLKFAPMFVLNVELGDNLFKYSLRISLCMSFSIQGISLKA